MSASKISSKSLLDEGDLSKGGSENGKEKDTNSSGRPERSVSPEIAKCAICLGDVVNRSCSNSCAHQFCFGCLLEWSKVKPECPLCKCSFRAIYHNFRNNDEFDEYVVPTPVPHLSIRFTASGTNYRLSPFIRVLERAGHQHSPLGHAFEGVTIPAGMFQPPPAPVPQATVSSNPFNNGPSSLRPEFFGDLISEHRRNQEEAVQMPGYQNRRRRYDRNEWVQPFGSALQTGVVIRPSIDYIRHHPSAISRLRNWLYRELNVLLGLYRSRDQMAFVYDLIMHLINHYDVRSRDFRDMVNTYFGTKTAQFQHELYHFILSGMGMEEYDRAAEYPSTTSGNRNAARRNAPPEVITLDSDEEDAAYRNTRDPRRQQSLDDIILVETSSDEEGETFGSRNPGAPRSSYADVTTGNGCSTINFSRRTHTNPISGQEPPIPMPDLSIGVVDASDEREGAHRHMEERVSNRDPEMPVLEPQVYPFRSTGGSYPANNDSISIIDHSRATAATTTVTTSSRSVPSFLSPESLNQNMTRPSVLSSGMSQHNDDMVRLLEPDFDIDLNVSVESYSSPPRQTSRPLTSPDFPILQLRRNIDRGRSILFERRSRVPATGSNNSGGCPFSAFESPSSGSSSRGNENMSAFVPYESETSNASREELTRPPRPSCIHGTSGASLTGSHNLSSSASSAREYRSISPTPAFRIDLYPRGMSSSQVMDLSRSAGLVSNSLSSRATPGRSPNLPSYSQSSPPLVSHIPPPAIASSSSTLASNSLVETVEKKVSAQVGGQQSDSDELECLGTFPIVKKPPLAVITLSSDDEDEGRVKSENKHERLNILTSDDDTNLLDGFLNWAAHPLPSDFNLLDVPINSPPIIDFQSSSSSSSNLLPVVPQQQSSTCSDSSGRARASTSSGSSAVISIPTIPSFRLTIRNNSVQNTSESCTTVGSNSSKQPVASASESSDRHRKKHKHSSPKKSRRRLRVFSTSEEESSNNNDDQLPKSVQPSPTVPPLKIPKKRKYTTAAQESPDVPSFSTSADSSVDSDISSLSDDDDDDDSDYVVFDYAKPKTAKSKKKSSPKKKHKSKTKKAKKTKKSKDKDKEKSRKNKKGSESKVKASGSSDASNTTLDVSITSSGGSSSRHSHKRVKKGDSTSTSIASTTACASGGASSKSTVQAPITTSSPASFSFSTPIMNMPICDFEYPSGLLDLSFNNRTEQDETPLLPTVDDDNTIDIRIPPPAPSAVIDPSSLSSTVDTSAIFGSPSRTIFNAFWDDFASVADRRNNGWND